MTVPPPAFFELIGKHLPVVWYSGIPVAAGLLVLQIASRKEPDEMAQVGFRRGLAFVAAGFLLLALPLYFWAASLQELDARRENPVAPGAILLLAGYLAAVFFWLIWKVNAYTFRPPGPQDTPWETNWGESYSPELKRRVLAPLFAQMDKEAKIGDLVVDIGSSAAPVCKFLPSSPDRKFILIDIAAKNRAFADELFLRLNAENIAKPGSLSYQKALIRVCRFLSLDARAPAPGKCATTMVFSDILNYVDYRSVIRGCAGFLNPGGRMIIVNLSSRGIREEFSEKGLKANDDLYPFLREQNLTIEYKDFPCRPEDATDESEELIVLVASKETPTALHLSAERGGGE